LLGVTTQPCRAMLDAMVTPGRIAAALAIATTTLGLASATYRAIGEVQDRRNHPPPGRLVDVGGYQLHIRCAGHGSPPVVIIPELGGSVAEWQEVLPRIADETQVCVYDRAGLAYSEPPPRWRRTASGMAGELRALLHNAGIRPPYVLAGHSIGGLVALVFTRLYPADVAGLALIESSHPGMRDRLPPSHMTHHSGGTLLYIALKRRTRPLGLLRLARDLGPHKTASIGWAGDRRATDHELLSVMAICREAADTIGGGLGNLPITVLTASEFGRQERRRARYQAWLTLQDELATLSANSTHVIAEHGGHHLNQDNPELVSEAISELVKRVRSGG